MIKIIIVANGENVFDEFKSKKTTLAENCLCLRKLEEAKQALMNFDYHNDYEEITEGGEEDEEDD